MKIYKFIIILLFLMYNCQTFVTVMAKKKIDNEIFKTLIEDYNIKDTNDIDEALMKSVYLSLKEATKKWTGRIPGWGEIYSQLSIYFEGRI